MTLCAQGTADSVGQRHQRVYVLYLDVRQRVPKYMWWPGIRTRWSKHILNAMSSLCRSHDQKQILRPKDRKRKTVLNRNLPCSGATLMPIRCKQGQPDQGFHPQISPFTLRSVLYSVSVSQRHQPLIADTRSNRWKKPQHTEIILLPLTVKLDIMALVCVTERYKGCFGNYLTK